MNSTGELHPNWRSLATIHFPLKRFVTGVDGEECSAGSSQKYTIPNLNGQDIKLFYEGILADSSIHQTVKTSVRNTFNCHRSQIAPTLKQFNKVKFFRCAMENDAEGLQQFLYKDDEINTCDEFGWTALMMAACAGAANGVKILLQLGAKKEIHDASGRTAENLAEINAHFQIVELLKNDSVIKTEKQGEIPTKPFFCDICQHDFKESRYEEHLTSTIHQFNAHSNIHKLQNFNIASRNRGLQLMLKQGWDKESGLGPSSNGRLYPVKTVIRKQRTGLGVKQSPARVTHFDAYDTRAIACHYSDYSKNKKPRSRNDVLFRKKYECRKERRLRRELS